MSLDKMTVAKGGTVMTRKGVIDWAAEDTAAALYARYRSEKVAEVRTRLHALWLLRQGQGPTAVAAAVGVSLNSVQQWLRRYRAGGPRCAPIGRAGTAPSCLTEAQARQVVQATQL